MHLLQFIIVFTVYSSFYDRAEFVCSLSAPLITCTYLMATEKREKKRKRQQFHSTSSFFFSSLSFFLNSNTAASVGRKKKKKGTKLCLSGFFSHKPAGGKASEKSRWAQFVVAYESAEICSSHCEGKICHPLRDQQKYREDERGWERLKAEREELLRFCRGWIQWVVVRPPVGCQFALWFLYRPLPGEGRGWQDGRLRLSHKTHALTALFLNHVDCMWGHCAASKHSKPFSFF